MRVNPLFYLHQLVAVFIGTLLLDSGRVLAVLLVLLLLLNVALYFFKIKEWIVCVLPYLLLVLAVCVSSAMAVF